MEKRRTIRVKKSQYLSEGDFGAVYRISKYKIVKVYHEQWRFFAEMMAKDEIKGSKKFKNALPVIEVVNVVVPNRKDRSVGLVRRYIPYNVFNRDELRKRKLHLSWDARPCNFMKDSNGKIWRVDTQTKNGIKKIEKYYSCRFDSCSEDNFGT